MKNKVIISYLLAGFFFSCMLACAEEEGKSVDYTVVRMKSRLNLTQQQVAVVKPIVQEYMDRCQDLAQSPENTLMPDKRRIRSQEKQLKEEENEKLCRVLTPDQMNKWEQDESIKDFLNQDQMNDTDRTPQRSGKHLGLGGSF